MRTPGGFSLIEVLVALTLLGIALLLGMDLVLQNPRIVLRLDAERQAFRAMESTMEAVRAGVIPLGNADSCPNAHSCQDPECPNANLCSIVRTFGPPPVPPPQPPKDYLTISMQVVPTGLSGLSRVTLVAQYLVLNKKYEKKLQTMVWISPT